VPCIINQADYGSITSPVTAYWSYKVSGSDRARRGDVMVVLGFVLLHQLFRILPGCIHWTEGVVRRTTALGRHLDQRV